MSWFKFLTTYLVSAQLVLAPVLSHAGAAELEVQNNRLTEAGKSNVEALSQYGSKLNFDSRLDLANNKMYFIDRESKQIVSEVLLRDEKSLMEYSPKNLNQRLNIGLSNLKTASKQSAMHAWKAFPVESAAFFLALGAMAAVQLITNYADNPIGMKQHIEHSFSPVGQLGFFMFMYTQGVTANSLNLWLKNPKLGMPIGMLGMTVGMAAQSYFTQVISDPHIRVCAASIFKGAKIESNEDPCEQAYKYLVIDKKILEGPGIASLLGSFLVVTGGRLAVGSVLRLVGIELTTLLVPGGVHVKGARWMIMLASSGVNAAAFTVVQMKLEHMISYAWKNYFDGKEFVIINDDLVANIETQKKSRWNADTKDFNNDLKHFAKKMSEWRVTNLSEAYMANQAWAGFLGDLTAMYSASYNFYNNYVQELNGKDSLIDRPYPLFGVTPKGLAEGHNDNFLNRPERIERMQAETTLDVALWIGQNLETGYFKKQGLTNSQVETLAKIQAGLASEDLLVKGQALLVLQENRREHAATVSGTRRFGKILNEVATKLGKPNPMMETGRGYAASMLLSPSTMEAYKDVKLQKTNGRFSTPEVPDYFVIQMMCGPDVTKNEKVISIVKGFPAKFSAPTITLDNPAKEDLCSGFSMERLTRTQIYNMPYSSQKTAPDFLRANMNPEVAENFNGWWEKNTESQLKSAFSEFGKSYKEIIKKLYTGLNQTKNSAWNRGLISNGAIISTFQEMRLYSMILGELLKDNHRFRNNSELPAAYFSQELEPHVSLLAVDYKLSRKPLLGLLGRGARYDFNTLMSSKPNADMRSLKIQKELETSFAQLNGLIQKARNSAVKSEDYAAQLKVIEDKLSEFGGLLGVSEQDGIAGLVTLSKEQKTLAVTCLELLQALSQELTMYGNMAGTARYPDAN